MHRTAPTHPSLTPANLPKCIAQHPSHTVHLHRWRHAYITQYPRTLLVHPPSCRNALRSTDAPFTVSHLPAKTMHCAAPSTQVTPALMTACIPYIAQYSRTHHEHPPSCRHALRSTHACTLHVHPSPDYPLPLNHEPTTLNPSRTPA